MPRKASIQARLQADGPQVWQCHVAEVILQPYFRHLTLGRRIVLPRNPLRQVGLQAQQNELPCGGGVRGDSLHRFS